MVISVYVMFFYKSNVLKLGSVILIWGRTSGKDYGPGRVSPPIYFQVKPLIKLLLEINKGTKRILQTET